MDNQAKRLVIQSMEIENFKSYYGKHVLGPFHPYFSCVVGPNGSGKSNVIDALLFVFGFRAKNIRMKRVEELIHHSNEHMDVMQASVAINFALAYDSDDDSAEIEKGSEFVVSRTVIRREKSTASIYRINHRECTLSELEEKLNFYGLDINHNRFLILQGEVESISLMKPKGATDKETGLLEYIEEIIGTNTLIAPIKASEEALEQLTAERQGKIFVVRVAESEKTALEGPKDEAENYVEKQRELIQLKARRCLHHLTEAEEKQNKFVKLGQEANDQLKEKREALAQMKEEEKKLNAEYVELKKMFDTESAIMLDVNKKLAESKSTDADLKKEKEALRKRKDVLEKEDSTSASAAKNSANAAQDAEDRVKRVEEEIERCQEVIDEKERELDDIRAKVAGETTKQLNQIEELKKKRAMPEKQLKKLSTEVKEMERRLNEEREEEERTAAELKEAEEMKTRLEASAAESKERIEMIEAARQEILRELKEKEAEIKALREQEARLNQRGIDLQGAIASFEARLSGTQSLDASTKALMEMKKQGKISGFYGRLGALGQISRKHRKALVAVAGGRMQNFVVETAETASACVGELKAKRLGVETFMVLEKLREQMAGEMERSAVEYQRWAEEQKRKKVQCLWIIFFSFFIQFYFYIPPMLYDLLDPADPMFAPCFFFAVRSTLVTENLTDALHFAYEDDRRRKKVVTLDGEVVDPSGTMSGYVGGGRRGGEGGRGRGRGDDAADNEKMVIMGEKGFDVITEEEEKEYQRKRGELEHVNRELQKTRQSIDELETEMRERRRERADSSGDQNSKYVVMSMDQLNVEERKAKMESESISQQMHNVLSRLSRLTAAAEKQARLSSSSNESEKKKGARSGADTDALIEAKKSEAKRLKKEVDALNEEIEALKKVMDAKGGTEMAQIKAELVDNKRLLEEKQKMATQWRFDAKNARKKAKEIGEKGERGKKEKVRIEARMEEIDKIRNENVEKAAALFNQWKELEEKLDGVPERLEAMEKEHEEKKEEITVITKDEVALAERVKELNKQQKENERVVEKWMEEIEVLRKMTVGPEDEAVDLRFVDDVLSETPHKHLRAMNNNEVAEMEGSIRSLSEALAKVQVDLTAIASYRKKAAELEEKKKDLAEVTRRRDEEIERGEQLKKQRLDGFMNGFRIITLKLKEMYQMITLGGDAELELVDSADPFTEGITFTVRPPTKSWKYIQNLSGGEKTLSSLSLVFALHHFRPNPLYVMDEIDAALDFRNVSIIAQYVKSQTRNAQFIIISLRNNMFELADRLIGIYKTHNCTKSVAINPSEFEIPSATQQTSDNPEEDGSSKISISQ
ncbi:Structural maintenance of chromosomes 4, SMC4 [Monocercomonoides exilis]|uniref:Structural maintenance of chromosomes 4, SMC4 n=1 Tax=Monocercomonoides exilis TaxID=2049356 RepID=UPI00355A0F81|nr:Structural maintenance of chromosomes 4, SMC4 [Monocercomonoides exilis]|eukprot:MONOS_11744.1-p1 / transcript=MONOS_11744.1 / gene=MONOS_11744 / organism=Monocercomonoides_exilis_PA203 / gene_product=Structural maintenance of chromosomes 4, SMC4 / transcript_product=Structural maintenance of chromosomes 4, SMC4 / location=Mono_scaffold00607:15592-20329(-) / protein_length=1330 / sequence_SO=supercontig / SO=protein_coding / is_pseudo=false